MHAHSLATVCSDIALVDRLVCPLSAGVQPGGLLLADVDADGDAEIVVGAEDGTLSVFKGRSPQPLQVLSGFGPIVAIAHAQLNATQAASTTPEALNKGSNSPPMHSMPNTHSARSLLLRSPIVTATSPPQSSTPLSSPVAAPSAAVPVVAGSRLLVVNSEGDLFVLEISQARMMALARAAEAAAADSRTNADDEDDRVPSAEWNDEPGAADRREHYASSGFLSSHQRFRVPINVSSMECVTEEHAPLSVVLGTMECSLHVYTLHAERSPEELALEAAMTAAAMARAAAALAAQAREEEQQSGVTRGRGVFGSNSPVLSGPHSRRGSLTGSGAVNQLSQLGPPVLPTSASTSNAGSPVVRGRVILQSNHFAPITASASGPSSSGPQIAAFNVARKPAPSGPLPPQPSLVSSVSATASSTHSGASSNASSTSHTRTNSPTLSSSILTAINQQQTPSPALQGHSASSTPARSRARSPAAPASPARIPSTKPAAPTPSASTVTWILRLELVRQLMKLPHPVHALSSVSCDQAPSDWRQSAILRNASMTSLSSDSDFSASLPPGAFTLGADPSAIAASSLTLPSNCEQLMPLWTLDATTMHVLPSKLFQRSQASQKKHTRAESGPGAAAALPPSAPSARSISSAANLQGSSASNHASLKDLNNLSGGGVVNSPSLNPRPVGRSGMSSMLQPSHSGSNSAIPSRKNSGAHPSSSLFHSPQLMGRPAPNASPKFGPQAPMSITNSPRFSFLTANQQNANAFVQQQSMYSMSVSASPAFAPLASTPQQPLPALSLGAPVAVDPVTASPVSLLPVSPRLLLVALEEGAVLFDWLHGWAWALSFPRPGSALTAGAAGITSPGHAMRSTSSNSVVGLASSESLNSLSSITPAGVSAPSSTPPPILVGAVADVPSATSPPTAELTAASIPSLQRTLSAPAEAVGTAPTAHSASSTPQLRPAQASSTGSRAPQPAGINLSALNNNTNSSANPTPVQPSPLRVMLPQTTGSQTPYGLTPMAHSEDAALLSPGTTPVSRSMTSSRNVSYANLGGATPKLAATHAPGSTTHDASAHAAATSAKWDVVRARMCGDVQLPGFSSEEGGCSSRGVFVMLDALGRVSVQHLAAQLQDESDDPADVSSSSCSWYHYSLQLPGQFLALSSLPLCADAPEAAGSVLTACSLDGAVYFVPIASMQKPALPPKPASTVDESSPSSFHVCRFQYPSRISAFRSGLYSLSAGQPSAALVLVTFQNELIIFPAALETAGLDEWTHEWKWRQHKGATPTAAVEEGSTSGPLATTAEGAVVGAADLPSPVSEPPSYSLTLESSRRTLLSAWQEHDAAAISAGAADAAGAATHASPTSLAALLKWTSSAPRDSSDTTAASLLSPASAAPYLRDLQNADLILLNEYRRLLRRKLGLADDEEDDDQRSENGDEGLANDSRSGSDDDAAEAPHAAPSPSSRRGHHRRGTGSSIGSMGGGSPRHCALGHLQSSPLFAPFRQAHFAAGPMALANSSFHSAADSHGLADLSLLRSQSDPLQVEEGMSPARANDDREQSPSFWRKLMRRTK